VRLPSRPSPVDLAVDTSALISILQDEHSSRAIEAALAASESAVISAASLMEASVVACGRHGKEGLVALDRICDAAGLVVMPVDSHQLAGARAAFTSFGKGRHRAGLNFGDCFSYSLAAHFDVPLLCTGDDFAHTGLRVLPTAR